MMMEKVYDPSKREMQIRQESESVESKSPAKVSGKWNLRKHDQGCNEQTLWRFIQKKKLKKKKKKNKKNKNDADCVKPVEDVVWYRWIIENNVSTKSVSVLTGFRMNFGLWTQSEPK